MTKDLTDSASKASRLFVPKEDQSSEKNHPIKCSRLQTLILSDFIHKFSINPKNLSGQVFETPKLEQNDIIMKCCQSQDFHLMHLKKILLQESLSTVNIKNWKIPKKSISKKAIDSFITEMNQMHPDLVKRYYFSLLKLSNTDNRDHPEPPPKEERQFYLTRITDFFKTTS